MGGCFSCGVSCSHLTAEGAEPALDGGTGEPPVCQAPREAVGTVGVSWHGGNLAGLGGAVGTEDGDEFLPSSGRALRGLGCQEPEGNVVTRDHG